MVYRRTPIGTGNNFHPFRAGIKIDIKPRKRTIPLKPVAWARHTLRSGSIKGTTLLIKKKYPESKTRQIVANKVVRFLLRNPTATMQDIGPRVFSELKNMGLKISYDYTVKGKKFTQTKPLALATVSQIYKELVGSNGVIERTSLTKRDMGSK